MSSKSKKKSKKREKNKKPSKTRLISRKDFNERMAELHYARGIIATMVKEAGGCIVVDKKTLESIPRPWNLVAQNDGDKIVVTLE